MVGLVTFSARKMPRLGITPVIRILERKDAKLGGRALIVTNVSCFSKCVVYASCIVDYTSFYKKLFYMQPSTRQPKI